MFLLLYFCYQNLLYMYTLSVQCKITYYFCEQIKVISTNKTAVDPQINVQVSADQYTKH